MVVWVVLDLVFAGVAGVFIALTSAPSSGDESRRGEPPRSPSREAGSGRAAPATAAVSRRPSGSPRLFRRRLRPVGQHLADRLIEDGDAALDLRAC